MAAVSIIVPIYNVDKYVNKCLESLVGQTFSDIEIILINDGSTDSSGERCLEWAALDDRIVYVSKKNEGAGPSRNLGIQMASAEFVAFCDPDDWYDERYVELMLERQNDTGADIVVCGWHTYDGNLDVIVSTYCFEDIDSHYHLWMWGLRSAVWCKLFRRALFIDNRIKMPDCFGQDSAIHYYIMIIANKVVLLNSPLYYNLFNRPGSAMNSNIRHTSGSTKYLRHCWDLFIRDKKFEKYRTPLQMTALGIIDFWFNRIKEDTEYTERWLIECLTTMNKYFRTPDKIIDSRVGVVGSYSLFNGVVPKTFAGKRIVVEYCHTGLLSYMSGGNANPPSVDNPFQKIALNYDFNKSLTCDISNGNFDFLILDFLDERFDLVEICDGYYTKSDVLIESNIQHAHKTIKRWDMDVVRLWKRKCIEFIELLKEHLLPQNVFLVKNLLTERFGTSSHQESFSSIDEIKQTNLMLNECYLHFETSFPEANVIEISNPELQYTYEGFRHGCKPWHYNKGYYSELREKVFDCMLSRHDQILD